MLPGINEVIAMTEYSTVSIPNDLIKEVDKTVKNSPLYTTRADYIKAAIRDKLENDIY